jgi:phenylalanyl-tRNA synthetase beta chain
VYPELGYRRETIDLKEACGVIGLTLLQKHEAKLLFGRVGFDCEYSPVDDNLVDVIVPPTRHDVIHAYDLYEELAVAYGYDNLEMTMPKEYVIAEQFQLNVLSDKLRDQVAQAGFTEAATFALVSRCLNYGY